jgi:hypothetical protein
MDHTLRIGQKPCKETNMSERNMLEQLNALYPHLSLIDIIRKVEASRENDFKFFRAFVPYFYELIRNDVTFLAWLEQAGLHRFPAWCVGDPHLENFGVVLGARHEPVFTVNDPDDGGPGYPIMDLLRFMVGLTLYNPDWTDWDRVMGHYLDGLSNGPDRPRLHALIHTLDPGPQEADSKDYHDSGRARLQMEAANRLSLGVKNREEKIIGEALRLHFRNTYQLCDLKKFKKKAGGSGGLVQYRVLLLPTGQKPSPINQAIREEMVILDLKPIVRSGLYPLICQTGDTPNPFRLHKPLLCSNGLASNRMARIRRTLRLERGGGAHTPFVNTLNIPEWGPCLLRPRWRLETAITLKNIEAAPIAEPTIQDESPPALPVPEIRSADFTLDELVAVEAHVLGTLHRKSLRTKQDTTQVADYINAFNGTQNPTALLIDRTGTLARTIQASFQAARAMLA